MRRVVLFSDVRGAGGPTDVGYVPLSLLTIATHLASNGVPARVIDAQFDTDWRLHLREALQDAIFLGLSAFTGPSLTLAIEAAAIARNEFIGLPVVWGGYHATQAFAGLLREGLADLAVVGPGEHAALALAKGLQQGQTPGEFEWLRDIADVAFLVGDDLILNRSRAIVDPALLAPVDYSFVDLEPYFAVNGRSIPYISSYGCPHACAFCAEPNQSLGKWRGRTPQQVSDDLAAIVLRHAPKRINVCDPNFSSSPGRVAQIVESLIAIGAPAELICDMRATDVLKIARTIDLSRLYLAGIRVVYIGGESGSDTVLAGLAKVMRSQELLDACQLLDDAGISTIVSFMHDLPDETIADSAQTFALATRLARLPGNVQRHHFFTPYPATKIYENPRVKAAMVRRPITQSDWAHSSTYSASSVWQGRPEFRARCLALLEDVRARLADPTRLTLPTT
jgi:radical SAM superfamily enzyme YgiQ (UPF0313 family)